MRTLAVLGLLFAPLAQGQDLADPEPPPTLPPIATPARLASETPPGPVAPAARGDTSPATTRGDTPPGATSVNRPPVEGSAPPPQDLLTCCEECICCDELCCCVCKLPSRWWLRHDAGDGVGWTRGFTYVEGLVPLFEPTPASVIFADARVVNFDDADRWEFNVGGGWRTYAPALDAVLGLNLFYDGRRTDANFFHQIGVGGEMLFPRCELRCNGYFIVGPSAKLAGETWSTTAAAGDQFIISRMLTYDVAMGGVDFEAGTMLPAVGPVAPRVFLGGYHYEAQQVPSATGIRGRLEAWIGRYFTLYCAVQHDDVFDTTVSGGIALHFGGGEVRRSGSDDSPRSVDERLIERVVRDVNIVVVQHNELQTFVLGPTVGGNGGQQTPPPAGSGEELPKEEQPKEEQPQEMPPICPPPKACPPRDCPPRDCAPKACPPRDCPPPACPPPSCVPRPCLPRPCPRICPPFPGRPGDPETFPGHQFPPGFHHACFPGRGRRHDCDDDRGGHEPKCRDRDDE